MIDAKSQYLYGDSTPAPLTTDFIAFLRDMVDFAVEVLQCEGQAAEAAESASLLSDATEDAIQHAETLAAQLCNALERADLGDADSLVARCAAKIRSETWNLVRSEAAAARAVAGAEAARATQAAARARSVCERALETLLLRQEAPDAVAVIKLTVEGGTRYEARLHAQTPYGLSWDVGLQIPDSHSLARVLRVDRIVERLDVGAPEETGWLHKGTKVRPLRIDRLYLAELVLTPTETFLKLRAAPDGTGAGCDLWFHRDASTVRLERILASGASPDVPYDVVGDDADKLRSFHDVLAPLVEEIAHNRQAPVTTKIDDLPIHKHEPNVPIERLIANVAPRVEEIAKRSLAPGELVLRRRLGDNHREEVFLSKAELLEKLEPLSPSLRRVFAPLNLEGGAELPPNTNREPAPPRVAVAPANGGPVAPEPTDTAPFPGLANEEPTVIVDEFADAPHQAPTPLRGSGVRPLCVAPANGATEAPRPAPQGAALSAAPRP